MSTQTYTPKDGPERKLAAEQTPALDDEGRERVQIATCGLCGRSWNDAAVSSRTPTPSARCPFEYHHAPIRVTLEVELEDARAIACVRRQDVAYDECEPADAQEIREHLEGVIENAREESDPDA